MKLAFLELPADERRLYIEQAAVRRNISPVVMEKDFWVCWLLGILFESEFAGSLVFKGGTSLSKVHRHVRAGSPTAAEIARHLLGESNAASVNPASTYRHKSVAEARQIGRAHV